MIYLWYQEEEGERADKWKNFLEHIEKSSQPCSLEKAHTEELPAEATEQKAYTVELQAEATEQKSEIVTESGEEGNDTSSRKSISEGSSERESKKEVQLPKETEKCKVQTWAFIRSSLSSIENMMSVRVRKQKNMKDEQIIVDKDHLPSIQEVPSQEASEDGHEEDIYLDASNGATPVSNGLSDGVKTAGEEEVVGDGVFNNSMQADQTKEDLANGVLPEPCFPWKQELESLVHGGVPKDLRGEVKPIISTRFL